jgi:hypothetical protein
MAVPKSSRTPSCTYGLLPMPPHCATVPLVLHSRPAPHAPSLCHRHTHTPILLTPIRKDRAMALPSHLYSHSPSPRLTPISIRTPTPQVSRTEAPTGLKEAPRLLKGAPRGLKQSSRRSPRAFQEGPRESQEASKTRMDANFPFHSSTCNFGPTSNRAKSQEHRPCHGARLNSNSHFHAYASACPTPTPQGSPKRSRWSSKSPLGSSKRPSRGPKRAQESQIPASTLFNLLILVSLLLISYAFGTQQFEVL